MSRIYFHNVEATAEVHGSERHLLGNYCSDALLYALGSLDSGFNRDSWILKHLPESCYLHNSARDGSLRSVHIETWLRVGWKDDDGLLLDGQFIPLFYLQLNSAVAMGGNALKLAAKIHGQCELHCFVEGPNRNWLADLIDEALDASIFRREYGWESVCELLRKADDSPVICSYSVSDSFPNRHVARWQPEADDEDGDGWYDLPGEQRWQMALDGLRNNDSDLEIKPEKWNDFYFGKHRVSGFDFRNRRQSPALATAS